MKRQGEKANVFFVFVLVASIVNTKVHLMCLELFAVLKKIFLFFFVCRGSFRYQGEVTERAKKNKIKCFVKF